MLSPSAWEKLPEIEKLLEFEKAKQLAGLHPKKCIYWICSERIEAFRDHIYRPLLPLSEYWAEFGTILNREFPDGEYSEFHDKAATLQNYTTLYNWVGNNCEKCGSANISWDQGDKSICTYCPDCRAEKPFVKGGGWH
jgi:formamidopyrimidine-DNA glycosylase